MTQHPSPNPAALVIRVQAETKRNKILYDIANLEGMKFTYYAPNSWPGDFDLSGALGAALRLDNLKLVEGSTTIIGCSSNCNGSMGGSTPQDRVPVFNLSENPKVFLEQIDWALTFQIFQKLQVGLVSTLPEP